VASESALQHGAVERAERRKRWALVVLLDVLAGAVAWIAFGLDRSTEVARGRAGDACPAKGPAGLVGLHMESGKVRWTNVVGPEGAPVSIEPGRTGRVVVRGGVVPARTARTSTGDVISCRKDQSFASEPATQAASSTLGQFTYVLADGWRYAGPGVSPGVENLALSVTATRPDGQEAWTAAPRKLVGAVPGTVVTELPEEYRSTGPAPPLEALDAVTGEVRWSKVVSSNDAVVTSSHLVAVDVDSQGDGPSTVSGYLLSDGSLDWSVDVDSSTYPPYHLFVAGDRVYAPTDGEKRLVEIDSSQGRIRRTMDLPSPGMGGKWSEHGDVRGIVMDEATGTLVVAITANEPYRD